MISIIPDRTDFLKNRNKSEQDDDAEAMDSGSGGGGGGGGGGVASEGEGSAARTTSSDSPSAATAPPSGATPGVDEAKVTQLVSMGFPRERVIRALEACDGNIELCLELLSSEL